MKPHVAASSVRAAAQRVSSGDAQLALELVGFNQDLGAAMQYVFGNAFVCKVSFARFYPMSSRHSQQQRHSTCVHAFVPVSVCLCLREGVYMLIDWASCRCLIMVLSLVNGDISVLHCDEGSWPQF